MFEKPLIIATAVLFVTLATTVTAVEEHVETLCSLIPDNTRLGSLDSCETYYVCRDGVGEKQICPTKQAFDKNTQSCRAASLVNCGLESNPCASKHNVFVQNSTNCGWIHCMNNEKITEGVCPPGQYFNGEICDWGDCTNDAIGVTDACQVVPIQVFFGNNVDCTQWHRCVASTNGETLQSGNCPSPTVFNVQTGECVDNVGTVCDRVENAPEPEIVGNTCDSTFLPLASSNSCSIGYICVSDKIENKVCPNGQHFHESEGNCQPRENAVNSKCNRCEGTTLRWANAVDPECRKYFICGTTLVNSCPLNSFFNERMQACVNTDSTESNLVAYRLENPVCN